MEPRRSKRIMNRNSDDGKSNKKPRVVTGSQSQREAEAQAPSNSESISFSASIQKTNIVDLNCYCFYEIMSYLTIDDLVNLDMTDPSFGQATPHYYSRHSWQIYGTDLEARTSRVWRKIGAHVSSVSLGYFEVDSHSLEQAFDYFPNIKRLALHEALIYRYANLPKQVESLKLAKCRFGESCDLWFEQMSSTLTEITLNRFTNTTGIDVPWNHLRQIRRASFTHCNLKTSTLITFFENNRKCLESVELVHATADFGPECYRKLSRMSKVKTLAISSDIQFPELSEAFRNQLKCIHLVDHSYIDFICSSKQLECFVAYYPVGLDYLPAIINAIPTLKMVQLSYFVPDNVFVKQIKRFKEVLEASQRKFTLILSHNKAFVKEYNKAVPHEFLTLEYGPNKYWLEHYPLTLFYRGKRSATNF